MTSVRLGIFSLFLLIFFSVAGFSLLSANIASATEPSSISITVAPQNPAPGESVTISVSSFAVNLDSVKITWFAGGKVVATGTGKKSVSLNAGAASTQTVVEARIALPDGEIDKKVTIRPSPMTILWQANDSYVPPFYKGKAMPSEGSDIKVVAVPEIREGGVMVSPENMTYDWQKDYNNDASGGGYGKNYYIYTNDYLESSNTISVTASTVDQLFSSSANVTIAPTSPIISFYLKNPVLGVTWDNALVNGSLIKDEDVVFAAPYFISPKNIMNPELTWEWLINDNQATSSLFFKNTLPLKVAPGTSGTSLLRLNIGSNDKIFESATKSISVSF
jgi:hypothetical protein